MKYLLTHTKKLYQLTKLNVVSRNITSPSALAIVSFSNNNVQVSWTIESNNEDGFRAYYSTDNTTFTEHGTAGAGVASYTFTGLSEDTLYYFYVKAYKDIYNGQASTTVSATTLNDEYYAVYSAMVTKGATPSSTDITIQSEMMKSLVDRGYYAKAEFIDIFCTQSGASDINWKDPSNHNPIPVNSPVFEEYVGYTGSSAGNKYVRLNFIPSSDGVNITKTNLCLIYGCASDVKEDKWDVGVFDGSTSLSIMSRDSVDSINMFANADASGLALTNTNSIGHYAFTRNNNTTHFDFKNVYLDTRPGNNAAENLVTKELYACGRNQNGTPAPCNRTISYVMLFSYLNKWEVEEVVGIMERYLRNYSEGLFADKMMLPQIDTLTDLELDTYVEVNGSTVHPSVIYQNVGSYNLWMANTPFTNGNTDYENPSIWASNDGDTWVVPDGLTNPIVPKPTVGFNNDNDIFYENGSLYVIFNNGGILSIISSSDGITWGAVQPVTTDGVWIGASPSLIKIGSTFYLYYIDKVGDIGTLRRQSSNNILGPYSNIEDTNLNDSNYWHFDIVKINSTYWLPIKDLSEDNLELFYSTDGLTFVQTLRPIIRYGTEETSLPSYRPTIVELPSGRLICYVPLYDGAEYFTNRLDLMLLD